MKDIIQIFVFLTINIFVFVLAEEGDTCYFGPVEAGICTKLSECPSAMESVKAGNSLLYCGFKEFFEPTVCCELDPDLQEQNKDMFCAEKPVFYLIGTGGENSLSMEFPHMAALGYSENGKTVWACGGTLITKQYVLTAAHCLFGRNLGEVKYVRLGDLNLYTNTDDAAPQDFTVISRIKHPDFKPPSQYHDIGLIKLDREAELNVYVRPACLNAKKEIDDGIFTATGWGQLEFGGSTAEHLQKMTINIIDHEECKKKYKNISKRRLSTGIVDSLQICAGAPKVDTCAGDSGGPLQKHTSDGKVVYGVTSVGMACGISNSPGVYTRVSNYIDWIKSVVLEKKE